MPDATTSPSHAAAVPYASRVNAGVSIHHPRAGEMRLRPSTDHDALFLTLSDSHVWFCLGMAGTDVPAEIAAMERLSALAAEAADQLRALHTATRERAA
ncbi:hypothetical protein ACIBKY_39115 [Nonomuraea sp. NPDC050394]|uniref:hypothetical protein n=1 Tax=Nonomuraea sp. NPDC050394 TaxID=3364363 RepID=UPI0037A04BB2